MKRIISLLLVICLSVNMAFAFDPYVEEEVEKKSPLKLIYGIALTLTGAFLAYDGFSKVEVDVSKPSVDYMTVVHAEWNQSAPDAEQKYVYTFKSGYSGFPTPTIDQNIIYNSGNVDLTNVKIEVRYFHVNQEPIVVWPTAPRPGDETTDIYGYRTIDTISLAKGESITWEDTFAYYAAGAEMPGGTERQADAIDATGGLYRGEATWEIMEVRLDLSNSYTRIYEKKNKSDLEGAAGIVIASAGIYFLADYFIGLKKFDRYMKQNQMNIRLATYPSEYKLLFQKRI